MNNNILLEYKFKNSKNSYVLFNENNDKIIFDTEGEYLFELYLNLRNFTHWNNIYIHHYNKDNTLVTKYPIIDIEQNWDYNNTTKHTIDINPYDYIMIKISGNDNEITWKSESYIKVFNINDNIVSIEKLKKDYMENKNKVDTSIKNIIKNQIDFDNIGTKGTKLLECANKSAELYKSFSEITFDDKEFYIIDLSKQKIGSENIKVTKIIDSCDSKILSKIKIAANILKYSGMICSVFGIGYDIYKIFSGDKDSTQESLEEINKKLDIIINEIKKSTDTIVSCIKEELLKTELTLIKNPIICNLSKLHNYNDDIFRKEIMSYNNLSFSKLESAFNDLEKTLSEFNLDNNMSFIHRYLDSISKKSVRNADILNELIDLYLFYVNTINYCDLTLNKITSVVNSCKKLDDSQYDDLMNHRLKLLEMIIKYKNNDMKSISTLNKISDECIEQLYKDYKSKRLKVGDIVFIQSPTNNLFLSAYSRDYLKFCVDKKENWESFKIESNNHKEGEMILYKSKINLRSIKDGTYQLIGVYESMVVHEATRRLGNVRITTNIIKENVLTVATHHLWSTLPERMEYMTIIDPENSINNDHILFNSYVRISIKFNSFTKDLGYTKYSDYACTADNYIVKICN